MSNSKNATTELDAAALEHLKLLLRQRKNARAKLLKRRRRKSHQ